MPDLNKKWQQTETTVLNPVILWHDDSFIGIHTHLHEFLQLKEFAVQIFKILFEKFPESIIKHNLDQNTECLLFRHLEDKKQQQVKMISRKQVLFCYSSFTAARMISHCTTIIPPLFAQIKKHTFFICAK